MATETKPTMPKPNERYIIKDGILVDAEAAERLGIDGDYEFEHWADSDVVAEAVFGLSPEQGKSFRDSVPRDGKAT